MLRLTIFIALTLLATIAFFTSAQQQFAAPPYAWPPIVPYPQSFTSGNSTFFVDSSKIKMISGNGQTPTTDLVNGFQRFVERTFIHQGNATNAPAGSTILQSVTISVTDYNEALQLEMDESYKLDISDSNGIVINAQTVYGAYHALETLSQLTGFDFDTQTFQVRYGPWAITDAPRFPHRGILIDSARHFQPVATIKKVIDSITYVKMNLIHWHIVDAQSFPFDSPSQPKLSKYGAWSPHERFTASDVASVIEYARQRGVRVMMEIDTPGHSGAWCYGLPEICPQPGCPSKNINNWALDITKNETYNVVQDILTDITNIAFENLLHLGGDEVDTYCWSIHPYIMDWLNQRGLSLDGGFEYYLERIQSFAWNKLNRNVVGWQEIWEHFGTALNKKTIIQQWLPNSIALPLNVTSHGYRLIWSDSSVWYLDHLTVTWDQMYMAEPCNGLPEANCNLILGGSAEMWGETVDTSDILQTVWPRAAAVAERLWSPRALTQDITAALPRMIAIRCHMNERGVPAAPVNNLVARSAPPQPGSCFWQ